MSSAQVIEKAPARTSLVVVLLVLAAVVGAGTVFVQLRLQRRVRPYHRLLDRWSRLGFDRNGRAAAPVRSPGGGRVLHGPTHHVGAGTGSGRGSPERGWCFVGGGQAAVAKYDKLAKVPSCGTETHMTGARGCGGGVRPSGAPGAIRRQLVWRGRLWRRAAERDSRGGRRALPRAPSRRRVDHHPRHKLRIGRQPWRSDICSDRHLWTGRSRDQADQRRTKSESLLTRQSIVDRSPLSMGDCRFTVNAAISRR